MTDDDRLIEVQGTAEHGAFTRQQMDQMVDLAAAIDDFCRRERELIEIGYQERASDVFVRCLQEEGVRHVLSLMPDRRGPGAHTDARSPRRTCPRGGRR